MAGGRIKGITVEIGGDTTKLRRSSAFPSYFKISDDVLDKSLSCCGNSI